MALILSGIVSTISPVRYLESVLGYVSTLWFSYSPCIIESVSFAENPNLLFASLCSSVRDRKSTRLNSSHVRISYAVFCLKKKNNKSNHGVMSLPKDQDPSDLVAVAHWRVPHLILHFTPLYTSTQCIHHPPLVHIPLVRDYF